MRSLLDVDPAAWHHEFEGVEKYFQRFGDRMPGELSAQLKGLRQRTIGH
jgi:phosphoenolpyruvate carboxykinase (GTP)